MFFIDLLFAATLALVIAALLTGLMGWRHPRHPGGRAAAAVFLFFLLLAVIWAGGVWSEPFGPVLWGSYWLPFVYTGLLVALIILTLGAAAQPLNEPGAIIADTTPQTDEAEAVGMGITALFGFFFWVLLFTAAVAVTIRYFN